MKKILVVEDSALHQKMYDMVLSMYRSRGVQILHAANGRDALIELSGNPDTDLIILDVNMPVMSGLEFLRKVKGEAAFQAIPTLICSTEDKEQDIIRGLQLGARGYLTKPFKPADLLSLIERVMVPTPPSPGPGSSRP